LDEEREDEDMGLKEGWGYLKDYNIGFGFG